MKLDISISNFGKIKKAEINIRPFTVIAGKNSSGKSFVTKSLYSFFSTINKDYISIQAYEKIDELSDITYVLIGSPAGWSQREETLLDELLLSIENLSELTIKIFGSNAYVNQLLTADQLKKPIADAESIFQLFLNEISGKQQFLDASDYFEEIEGGFKALKALSASPKECLSADIQSELLNALKENFQVASLQELKNYHLDDSNPTTFNFKHLGQVDIQGEELAFSLDDNSIDSIQKLHNVVYLESPVYWKMKTALLNEQFRNRGSSLRRYNKEESLTGVPQHFYNLVELLSTQAKTLHNIELHQGLNDSIGGEISISSTGELNFLEKGAPRGTNLHNTALGVTNLGIISLLLKKGVLSKGSFLFIDEPEVHLHPAWQKVMIETLYELSKQGVNIVIASHSIDMMKCVENIMQQLPEAEMAEHFGINQLNIEGESVDESPYPLRRIAAIKADLGESFADMMMESGFSWDDK
ncbi:MAG: AAA family ATPase [Methyloprofundus sp.]|nr:AAA family ATPase [Methyloprofundus sp.]